MRDSRIIFMGTPDFAATVLQGLIDAKYNVVGVISQPDKPVGRKRIIEQTPTHSIANKYNIPCFQPVKIRKEFEFVRELKPDLIVTCAYGQLVPQALLDIPVLGCINVHGSLLPKLRGGAPIHRAIIDDYKETGITIMQMIDKMDAGVMYKKKSIAITDEDTLGSLWNKLQYIGRDLLLEVIDEYIDGKIIGIPQDESEVTFAWNIKKEEEHIIWLKSARDVFNLIRGLNPVPGAYSLLNGEVVKFYSSEIINYESDEKPGTIIKLDDGLIVKCGVGALRIIELQFAGKKRMTNKVYMNGLNHIIVNGIFE